MTPPWVPPATALPNLLFLALLGPDDGWSLAPVAEWLLTEGQRADNAEGLVAGLTDRLLAVGFAFDRAARFRRDPSSAVDRLVRFVVCGAKDAVFSWHLRHCAAPDFSGNPIQHLRGRGDEVRYRPRHGLRPGNQAEFMADLVQEQISDYIALPMVF